jgi:hypothetical protein
MKIINRTHFQTNDLRKILTRCANLALKDEKKRYVTVAVVYGRRTGVSGCAAIGGYRAKLRINKHNPLPADFACVAVHEFRHLNGWTHAWLKAKYDREDVERYAWAREMSIRVRPPKKSARPSSHEKLTHAQQMLTRAQSRLKRAKNHRAEVGR